MRKKKVTLEQVTTQINENGEVIQETIIQTNVCINSEPNFIKLYLNTILATNDLNMVLTPLLLEILNICTYANNTDGQIFHFTKYEKEKIAKKLNTTENYLKQQILKLQKAGIVKNIARGVYAVNPFYFGKGEWKDIKNAQINFDFVDNTMTIKHE